ncbi:hypothetical protein [Legionella maioricensis]|uniref:Uncharacterized protein n=1 Tax=Legionella maioricensis TaxID=2896528 RepID=A0A9X2IB59_9GAMM|nr:hypothetical protein [Legionella maioricensis]MCL9683092.1 hypothetical protein [Legionella maioricensis]MCL9686440.1 hypothetical protein [Legionella maioricensis]
MGIPKKGLRRKQLKDLTAGKAVEGSHPIIRVEFIEDGITKFGYFKELEPKNHYPELLAKISVGTSLLQRLYLGKNCAEERLVFNERDELVGTLSIAIDGFKPFNYSNETVPEEIAAKEQVVPSTKTLLKKKHIEAAFAFWYGDNDDGHPHNNGFAGEEAVILDFDMFFYWLTILMKEARAVIGIPKKSIALTVRDWESFPIVKDSKPYHWFTYLHPGQESLPIQSSLLTRILPKPYADPSQFEQLAHEPEAHEQKFAVALKALLTFQPEVTRKRLTELFGDMTLNYTSLDDTDVSLRLAYEKEYPNLFNETTNTKPFVDFMMDIYQKHYDNLYRVVVFYMGCENNGYGVPLPATCTALYRKPSFYRKIEEWVKTQNETIYSKDEASTKYNLPELQNRYHQVWRDAHFPTYKELLHSCFQLNNKVLYLVSSQVELPEVEGKKVTDDTLTSAWEMVNTMPELSKSKIESLILVDKESKLRNACLLLVDFTNTFQAIGKDYFDKKREDLTEEDNLLFATQLKQLYEKFDLPIRENLLHTMTPGGEFNRISILLNQFAERINFKRHLTTTDEQMKDAISSIAPKEVLPHTDESIIKQFNDSLFLWAKGLKPGELSLHINEIIDTYYAPYVSALSKRQRTQPVKEYLQASQEESGDHRLAHIFSSGMVETGELNQLLIQHLTPLMLQSYPLLSVRNAVRDGAFKKDILLYTAATVSFAKHDKRFTHLYSDGGVKLFYKTMYEWVESLPQKKFQGIINSALYDYEQQLWWGTSRRKEVEGYFKTASSQTQILALIFLKGEKSSSLNDKLFQKIIAGIKTEIESSTEMKKVPGYKLISQFNPAEDLSIYKELHTYAEGPSHSQGSVPSSSTLVH